MNSTKAKVKSSLFALTGVFFTIPQHVEPDSAAANDLLAMSEQS